MCVPSLSGQSLFEVSSLSVQDIKVAVKPGVLICARNPEGLITGLTIKADVKSKEEDWAEYKVLVERRCE